MSLVKSGKRVRICGKLNKCMYFYDAGGFVEIGFVFQICVDFSHPAQTVAVPFCEVGIEYLNGPGKPNTGCLLAWTCTIDARRENRSRRI